MTEDYSVIAQPFSMMEFGILMLDGNYADNFDIIVFSQPLKLDSFNGTSANITMTSQRAIFA